MTTNVEPPTVTLAPAPGSAPPTEERWYERLGPWWRGWGRDLALHIGLPLATFAIVLLATSYFGVGRTEGCNGLQIFLWNLTGQTLPPSTCTSVPFLADAPTMLLSLTCPFALANFVVMRRRHRTLLADLRQTGLVPTEPAGLTQFQKTGRPHWSLVVLTAVASLAFTWFLLRPAVDTNYTFTLLASPDATSEQLAPTWWANLHERPILFWLAFTVGTVGFCFAFLCGFLYNAFGAILQTITKPGGVQYVASLRNPDNGWSPAKALLRVMYSSAMNFALSAVAAFSMIRGALGLALAFGLLLLGVVLNINIVVVPLWRINRAHRRVQSGLRQELQASGTVTVRRIEATADLTNWHKIRIFNVGAGRMVSMGYAVLQNAGPGLVLAFTLFGRIRGTT